MLEYKGFKISIRHNTAIIKGDDGVTIKKVKGANRRGAKRRAKRYIDRRKII